MLALRLVHTVISSMERKIRGVAVIGLMALAACSDGSGSSVCRSDNDCASGQRCAPDGRCIIGAECTASAECEATDPRTFCSLDTFTCEFREGFADECDTSRPCPFGNFCSTLLGRCFDADGSRDCTRRSQCPTGQICDLTANKCIPDLGCFGDEFCEGEEICDLVNRTCRAVTTECVSCFGTNMCDTGLCTVDTSECVVDDQPVCAAGEICDPLGRCVQCTRSEDCGPGLFCNTSTGRCESNVQCADDPNDCPDAPNIQCVTCELPEICDPRTRRCQAPPTPCESDTDCPAADEFCDTSLEQPICVRVLPECLDDLLDEPPNDSVADAAVLSADAGPVFEELKACPSTEDWYRLDVEAGTFVTVDLRFDHDVGDLEMQLYLPDGRTVLDESRSVTDNERVELEVGTDLTVFVRVFFGVPVIREVPYRLVVARDPGMLCPDDANEPDDTLAQAVQLTDNVPYEGRVCPADPDWFVLRSVPAGSRVDLTLDVEHNLGDLDLEVFRAGGATPLLAANSRTDNETLSFDASFGGDFFVRVTGKGADTNVYRLRGAVSEGMGSPCLDDVAEPNNSPTTASSTSALPVLPDRPTLCSGDDDWYVIELEPFEFLKVEMSHDPGVDLDLTLYEPGTTDPDVTPLRSSIGTLVRESIGYRTFEGGAYLVRVKGVSNQDLSPYDINFEVIPSLYTCSNDRFDAVGLGNDRDTPASIGLPPFNQRNLSICAGDEDWYRLLVQGGQRNVIRIDFLSDLAQLEIELYETGADVPLLQTDGFPAANFREALLNLAGQGPGFGSVDLRVFAPTGGTSPYTLSLDLIPQFTCLPDVSEPNNRRASPAQTVSSTAGASVADLTLCASTRSVLTPFTGDEDWFVLRPPRAGARIEARIDFAQGDLSMELFSPNGGPRACQNQGDDRCLSDGNSLNELISFTATTAEPYLLRVSSVFSSAASPNPPVDADTAYDLNVTYVDP